jgi:hypothetical protein
VDVEVAPGERGGDGAGQGLLDEGVAVQDHRLTDTVGPESLPC